MEKWIFLDFVSERGENQILSWLDSIPEKAKAKINARILTLASCPEFPPQYISAYSGWEGIFELRIGFGGREFRPLGCYLPDHRFAILVGAEEKGDKIPTNLLEVTHERRKLVIRDSSKLVPHDFS